MKYSLGILKERKHFQLTLDEQEFMQLCDSDAGVPLYGQFKDSTFLLYPGFSMPEQFGIVASGFGPNAYGAYIGMPLDSHSALGDITKLNLDEQVKLFDAEFKRRINSTEPFPIRFENMPNIDLAYVTVRVEE